MLIKQSIVKKTKFKKIILAIISVVFIGGILSVFISQQNKNQDEKIYVQNLHDMYDQSVKVREQSEYIIREYPLTGKTLADDSEERKKLNAYLIFLDVCMYKLKNPPVQYKKLYNKFVDLESGLQEFAGMSKGQEGRFQVYLNNVTDLDNKLIDQMDSIKTQMP
jgi:uncharacterized protein YxeA